MKSWSEKIADERAERLARLRDAACALCGKPMLGPDEDLSVASYSAQEREGRTTYAHLSCTHRPNERDDRPCEGCGYVRKVLIRYFWEGGPALKAYWSRHCSACEALGRAAHYERMAQHFQKKAKALFANRKQNLYEEK